MVNKKRASLEALNVNGAGDTSLLQLLITIIAKQIENIEINEMLCYA